MNIMNEQPLRKCAWANSLVYGLRFELSVALFFAFLLIQKSAEWVFAASVFAHPYLEESTISYEYSAPRTKGSSTDEPQV